MQPVCQEVQSHAQSVAATTSRVVRCSLEELAYRYGQYYDSYLATDHGRETFWSRDGRGAVAFARVGRYLNVGGGLLASQQHREDLLAQVVAKAEDRGDLLSFYNVAEHDLVLFRDYGFQATKLGEEAAIDLDDWNCRGKPFEWLRRQVNYCRRHGLEVAEVVRDDLSDDEWSFTQAELSHVSNAFLAAKPQSSQLKFLDGVFNPNALGRRRIFVARSITPLCVGLTTATDSLCRGLTTATHGRTEGLLAQTATPRSGDLRSCCAARSETGHNSERRIEGFLVCNPYRNGAGWAFEIYRQRPDAVRGTIPFLMHEAIETLRAESARRVSLCLVPGLRAASALPGDSALVRRGLSVGSRYFNFIFDTAGLYHYKSRFRPRFESRYLCARPGVTIGSAWSLVRLLGVLDLDAGKLSRTILRRLRHRARRSTLALPA